MEGGVSDVSLIQDEELLRKMWQETEDYGKKKEIRSHMYKIREARLKDFYTTADESNTSTESRQRTSITTKTSGTTGFKATDLTTHADNLADLSFLSLKSKEIRDSESPTKDSYKITETKKIDDRDWNIVESNESSRDGKTHTTSRIATTSGKQNIDGGEMNYAAKSEQKASVYKDGDDKNFTKSVGASSQNVIKQEAFGGDENSKFYSTSTTTSSSSKFTSEQRSTTGDVDYQSSNVKNTAISDSGDRKITTTSTATQEESPSSSVRSSQKIIRTVYTEGDIPNEIKTNPNTKVTTETKTLPDGSTVTTTRYETRGGNQYSTTQSSRQVTTSSSSNEQVSRSQIAEDSKYIEDNSKISNVNQQVRSKIDDSVNQSRILKSERIEERYVNEDDVRRKHDLALLGRDNVENVVITRRELPTEEVRTTTSTVTRKMDTNQGRVIKNDVTEMHQTEVPRQEITTTTTRTTKINTNQDVQKIEVPREEVTTTTVTTKKINTSYDNQEIASDNFLNTERRHTESTQKVDVKPDSVPKSIEPLEKRTETVEVEIIQREKLPKTELNAPKPTEIEFIPAKEPEKYQQPERVKPIKPGKSELDEKLSPTEGQYITTYRTDYVPRRISVEVSPTHDAFARSLRSISPDRISKTGSIRSLRTTSTTSLRSSPERPGKSSRPISPSKKSSRSPEKYVDSPRQKSPEKVPSSTDYRTAKLITDVTNTDTITRRKKTEVDSSTLTRRKEVEKPRSRSVSPTTTTSDFEFIRHHNEIVTDLDADDSITRKDRPNNLEFTKKPQKVTEKSATSPLSPKKSTGEPGRAKPKMRRTDTYEERCKEILGIADAKDTHRKASLPTTPRDRVESPTKPKKETSPFKPKEERRKSPEKKTSSKPGPQEFPAQIRKSPQKEPLEPYPEKPRDTKKGPGVSEFPSQIRKLPEKEPLEPYPEKPKDTKRGFGVSEFPAQIRKSPQKEPLEPYPEKQKNTKKGPSVSEFPSQIRKSPEKQPLERYHEKPKDIKKGPVISEFPAQIRKSPEKEPLEPYLEKPKDVKKGPSVSEFPSQIRKLPQKEPLEPYPEKAKGTKSGFGVPEFPAQIRKSPQKEPLEPYPEKSRDTKKGPSVSEFPSQIRKSPEKEPLEHYPEKPKDIKKAPAVSEFPAQIRKSPQKEPLEPYLEKPKDVKRGPSVSEFPSQIRKSPEKEPLEPYPEKPKDTKKGPSVSEFPAQMRKSPEKELLESPQKESPKSSSKPSDLYAEILRDGESPEREPLEYFDKPLERSPSKVSLDDLPLIKTDRVSLDDLPSVGKPQRKISLSDLDQKPDDFIANERTDTEITLRKYKDDSIGVPSGIPDVTTKIEVKKTNKTKKSKGTKKSKKGRTTTITGNESEFSSTEEEEENVQIIEDICDVIECTAQTSQPKKKPLKEEVVEDFVTVTKTQLLESSSKLPVEEIVHTKKFMKELCKDEEEDRKIQITEEARKSHKILKKDNPEKKSPGKLVDKKPQSNKENLDTTNLKKRTEIKITPKDDTKKRPITTKKIDDKSTYDTEYKDQYTKKTQKVSTTLTLSNEKKTPKKTVEKVEIVKKIQEPQLKKPESKQAQPKRPEPKQYEPKKPAPRITTTTTTSIKKTEIQPTRRHVVSTIINIKPKTKPETISKTIHKTTVTKTITAPKTITKIAPKDARKPKKKVIQNGYVSTDEEEEILKQKKVDESKKCITTKSILIENAVADQREIIVDLRRSKSSREGTPDRICPYPVSTTEEVGLPRYPDRVTEPDDGFPKPKRIPDIPETEDVNFERITEVKTEVDDECLLSVNEKVNKFLTTAEQVTKKPLDTKPAPKVERPKLEVDESLKEDECLLSVSDKVNKFIATAEQLASSTKEVQVTKTTSKYQIEEEADESVTKIKKEDYIRRSASPEKHAKTPERRSPVKTTSPEIEETPKSSRRPSKDVLSPTGRLRSTETIKKAKALFENIGNDRDLARQKDILSRPSVFEGRKLRKTETEERARTKLTYEEVKRSSSPQKDYESPHYMAPLDRTIKEPKKKDRSEEDTADSENMLRSRESSVDRDVPHYMLPLDRSVRERSPHKENLRQLEDIMSRSFGHDEVDAKTTATATTTTKFGVTLRRTDSGRMITGHRRSSASSNVEKQATEEEINVEEIYDLEYLEKLLETIVGYDIRRRIRAQIRVLKRAIEENTYETLLKKRPSPPKEQKDRKKSENISTHITEVSSEYHSIYASKRKTSSDIREPHSKSSSPAPRVPKDKSPSPLRKSSVTTETDGISAKKTKLFQTELKKTKPMTKTVVDEKPDWVTQRTLRKVSETSAPVKKTVASSTTRKETITKVDHGKPTDVITSSYGVGPMDENGSPLFGLKALRAQNKTEKTKVQGTVIQSHYHSENGGEPEGEITVTKFSTDPKDLGTKNVAPDAKGITSVTTTQKFGYKGMPSLKKLTGEKKTEDETETRSSVKTSKVTRRGSVKEISQKFIENAVDTLKSERQSSYPKAGLILRTSSFKDTTSNGATGGGSSREGSPASQEIRQKTVKRTTTTTTTTSDGKKSDTFLNNKSKVTGVQDVISRMKNDVDVEIEDTAEDAEARNLLNKFIGSQVLLSGMESHVSKSASATSTSSTTASGNVKRTTKITTTTTSSESSKPSTVTRTFTHPITPELLKTVWDESTLKLLLEQSTDYEDRRIIRARLREVMAEQEACAELVEKATSEGVAMKQPSQGSNTVHGSTTTRTFTEGPLTTTAQTTTRVTSQQQQQVKKPMSPFAKFRQLDKQNSLNSPPSTPKSPIGGGPLFKFTDPSLNQSANTVKQRLLQWCQMKTKEYENIQLDNFSSSWSDGMAFCALIHHFLPDAFDYKALNPRNRRHNFTLAFRVAEEKAGVAPLLDVDDMVAISKPDWKCVFTYVQSIYRRFKDED